MSSVIEQVEGLVDRAAAHATDRAADNGASPKDVATCGTPSRTQFDKRQLLGTVPITSLAAKLADAMVAIERIPHRGTVDDLDGSYPVARASDIYDAARKELGKRGVVVIGRPASYEIANGYVSVTFDFTIRDGGSGEEIEIPHILGRVLEPAKSDKGVQKAFTVAHKILLTNLLLISTGDVEETDSSEPRERHSSSGKKEPLGTEDIKGEISRTEDDEGEGEAFLWVNFAGHRLVTKEPELMQEIKNLGLRKKCVLRVLFKKGSKFGRVLKVIDPGVQGTPVNTPPAR